MINGQHRVKEAALNRAQHLAMTSCLTCCDYCSEMNRIEPYYLTIVTILFAFVICFCHYTYDILLKISKISSFLQSLQHSKVYILLCVCVCWTLLFTANADPSFLLPCQQNFVIETKMFRRRKHRQKGITQVVSHIIYQCFQTYYLDRYRL